MGQLNTFPDLLFEHCSKRPDATALRHKRLGIWSVWTWRAVSQEVRALVCGLKSKGTTKGDRIALIGQNIPELYWTLLASQFLGCIAVPVDTDVSSSELALDFNKFEISIVIVQDQQHVDLVLSVQRQCPKLRLVIYVDDRGLRESFNKDVFQFSALQKDGKRFDLQNPGLYEEILNRANGNQPSIVLRSTSSRPIIADQCRLISIANHLSRSEKISCDDEMMAYLPLSWPSALFFGYCLWLCAGAKLNIPENIETLFQNMQEIGPTFFYGPPIVYKKILTSSQLRMSSSSEIDRFIFHQCWDLALTCGMLQQQGGKISATKALALSAARMLIFNPLKNVYGLTALRTAVTGMEIISPDTLAFFRAIGIKLKQCYFLTESLGCLSITKDNDTRWNVIGEPLENVKVSLDGDKHIVIRCLEQDEPQDEDFECITDDMGEEYGDSIRIVGKNTGQLTGNIRCPGEAVIFESLLNASLFVKRSCVVSHETILIALIDIDPEMIGIWADERNIPYSSHAELATHHKIIDLIRRHVVHVNATSSRIISPDGPRISKAIVLPREFDRKGGELTPHRTICRHRLIEAYGTAVQASRLAEHVMIDAYDVPVISALDATNVIRLGNA